MGILLSVSGTYHKIVGQIVRVIVIRYRPNIMKMFITSSVLLNCHGIFLFLNYIVYIQLYICVSDYSS
jgi:hypothetical protein